MWLLNFISNLLAPILAHFSISLIHLSIISLLILFVLESLAKAIFSLFHSSNLLLIGVLNSLKGETIIHSFHFIIRSLQRDFSQQINTS